MIKLHHELTYRFKTRGPLPSTEGSPLGVAREYYEMSEGSLWGDRISAKIAMPGGDWMVVGTDALWRPDVRVQFVTDDGAAVLLHYTGLVQKTDAFKKAAQDKTETQWDDQYMRMTMNFDTGSPKYLWLTQSLFIATGRLAGNDEVEYLIYRVE